MPRRTRHVVFSPSTRDSLLQALKMVGRPKDSVVALVDDLQCGPIWPFDATARERWFAQTLKVGFASGWLHQSLLDFWCKALVEDYRLVVWTTRHSAQDRLGYLLLISQLGDVPAEVVDISEVEFETASGTRRPLPVPFLTPDQFVSHGLIDQTRPITLRERTDARRELGRLSLENGAFRQTQDGEVISLPLTAFDDELIDAASTQYRKAAFVIGTALTELMDRRGWYVSDLVLAARLMVLVEEGRLEAQGDPYGSIRFYEVRLPAQ